MTRNQALHLTIASTLLILAIFSPLPVVGASIRVFDKVPTFVSPADPNSEAVSEDAVQLAEILGLTAKFAILKDLKQKLRDNAGETSALELRQEVSECKLEIIEIIEQARFDIDFVFAEIEAEQAWVEELLQVYTSERDRRINNANVQAFRVNGALWAVAEALSIPTYRQPRYSIPAGAIGIVAGVVPSMFSLYAIKSMDSDKYKRESYPNILSKIFDYPTLPRIDYPSSVWRYLNAAPAGSGSASDGDKRIRLRMLKDHWIADPNVQTFVEGHGEKELDLITGKNQSRVSISLLTDRLIMLREVKAVVFGMNRPLRELSMVERGTKHF